MKRFLALLLALTLAISLPACSTQPKPFYSITTDDPVWQTFRSTAAMRAAIHLDESTFKRCSTKEVLRAVLEYPLIGDVIAYSSDQQGVEQTAKHCTALKVFLTRPDARQVLDETIANPDAMLARMQTDDDNKEMMPYVLEIISNGMDEMGK